MLAAIDRELAKALVCLQDNDLDQCRHFLEGLTKALPQMIAIIATENDSEHSHLSDNTHRKIRDDL